MKSILGNPLKKKGGFTIRRLKNKITSKGFDKKFDKNEDVTEYLDTSKVKVNKQSHRINIDFPVSFINKIDAEANKIGVARTALIKMWIAERIQAKH